MSRSLVLWVGSLVSIAACGNPSRLDHAPDHAPPPAVAADPWGAALEGSGGERKKPGFDLQGVIAKVKESIEKPGFYEAPEQAADYQADKPHWGMWKLEGELVERESFSFFGVGTGHGTELRKVIGRLRELAKDEQLQGLILRVGAIKASVPDLVELRIAMHDFRAAKKQLWCHTESASNGTYLALAACDKIVLAPLGEITITGPTAMPIHLKGLLDKLGVQADFIHVGAYKGAAEPLTRDTPSPEMREVLGNILDRRYATMVEIIASERKLDAAAVKALIDTGLFPAEQAQQARLVDEVTSFEMLRAETKAPWTRISLEPEQRDTLATYIQLARFIGAMPVERPSGDHVAVVYALGNIVDGDGDGILGARQQIAAHTLVAALHALAHDPSVKAVVLRIDSGGGSAQASELIWAAVADLHANKPVIVSMSDVAASGGYYIASGATKIFALDDTLTGSIGVVGVRISPAPALAKLGITTFPMGRGKHATMMTSLDPWTADEKLVIETTMKAVYATFKGRVAAGRHKRLDEIEPIAQGHVWTGAKAKELGLVDEIGGLDAALAEAQKLAKVGPTTELEVYPPSPTLRDFVHGIGGVQMPFGLATETQLAQLLDPQLAAQARRLFELARTFESSHVQTLAFVPELP
ncbi:signal peptide peptidase SppA [soil metagenome]